MNKLYDGNMDVTNIFTSIPEHLEHELFDTLVQKGDFKIERIVSQGHRSPDSGWHKQNQDEWVIVLQGAAIISFPDQQSLHLNVGDHVCIPAFCQHQVRWTDPQVQTIWIAVLYSEKNKSVAKTSP